MKLSKILLVEDTPSDQYIISRMLERLNCEVEVVSNGFEAVDAVRHNDYDLVFMDQNIPVLNGIEATHIIRELPEKQELPIIAISADAETYAVQAMAAGMNDFLSKPVAIYKFNQVLQKWIADYQSPYTSDQGSKAG